METIAKQLPTRQTTNDERRVMKTMNNYRKLQLFDTKCKSLDSLNALFTKTWRTVKHLATLFYFTNGFYNLWHKTNGNTYIEQHRNRCLQVNFNNEVFLLTVKNSVVATETISFFY